MNIKDIPEHRFTKVQIAELMKLLDHQDRLRRSANVNAATMMQNRLEEAAKYFVSSLVFQNAPSPAEEIAKLKSIESAANRILESANEVTNPYLRMMAGDIFVDDHKIPDLIASVKELKRVAGLAAAHVEKSKKNDAEVKRERQQIAKRRFRELREKGELEKLKLAKIRMTESRPKNRAMRVLIHELARAWLGTNGTLATVSVSKTKRAGGKFIRFAQFFIKSMRNRTRPEHVAAANNVLDELTTSADAISWHLKKVNEQLKPSLRNNQGEVSVHGGVITTRQGKVTTRRIT